MQWHELFQGDREPSVDDIAQFVGAARDLWLSMVSHFDRGYNLKPKLSYSACSMKPGWNVKFQKGGKALGTVYPERDALEVMVVIAYSLHERMEAILPEVSEGTARLYENAGDYMKMGRWMMLQVHDHQTLQDYLKIAAVKLPQGV